ncbi:MAG: sialate O-acetylesterase [Verrucomicrobiia bacterium]
MRHYHFKNVLACLALMLSAGGLWADVRLPAILSDNLVLQKGVAVPIRGWAEPVEKVVVEFAGQRKETVADKAGNWTVMLDPLATSTVPAELRVAGKNTVVVKNVLVGDVWLASGQSNMEMPVRQAANAAQEMASANYPEIRFFMVVRDMASTSRDDGAGKWVICTPADVGAFSAAAYFFARELHTKYRVPTGVINSSVGASSCQAWTPAEVLTSDPRLPQLAALAPENYRDRKTYEAFRKETYEKYSCKDPGVTPEYLAWAQPGLDVSDWKDFKAPSSIEAQGMNIDGAVWFRKEVDIPATWAGQNLSIALGPISDNDVTYMNGVKVGGTDNNWREWVFRNYSIPGKLVKAGRNVIAVRIFNRIGNGGFYPGYPAPLKLRKDNANEIILSGIWKSKVEMSTKPAKLPFTLPSPYSVPTAFFNAMIAPYSKFPLRGFIWYQGEGNAGAAQQHDVLFPAMIESWRKWWGDPNLPFYFVQLASFRARGAQPSEGGWARLRESQMKTLALHNTGMAVAIDIGEAMEIHPKNKQDVGKRLARWAMRDCYGDKDIEVSGPLYAASKVEGDKIRLTFTHLGGGLKAKGGELKGFAIAGADKKFVWASARIESDSVVVWSETVKSPQFVRYAWADNPECTLYNAADLPASPYRTDN